MKKIISKITSLLFLIGVNVSCDYVTNVNPPVEPTTGPVSNVIYRKVLVEDYTGHKCGNCPAAAVVLSGLETTFSGKIVPLAIHAGFFATTNVAYPTSFTTTAGNAYDVLFGNSAAGNPNGLVNRVGYGTGSFIKAYSIWSSEVAILAAQPAKFQIKIKNTFNTATNLLNTDITVKSLASNLGTYKLVVLLSQDGIIAEQLNYTLPVGSQNVLNYEFNHVLRGAINSEWGDLVFPAAASINDSVVKSFTGFSVNSTYDAAKCHVIAFVYDADAASSTFYEVLQVEEEKVK